MAAVPHSEAVAVLRWMVDNPDKVRAVGAVDDAAYGPFPFFAEWRGSEVELTLTFNGGVVVEVASVRVGARYSNLHEWDDNPWDQLSDTQAALLELSFGAASDYGVPQYAF